MNLVQPSFRYLERGSPDPPLFSGLITIFQNKTNISMIGKESRNRQQFEGQKFPFVPTYLNLDTAQINNARVFDAETR